MKSHTTISSKKYWFKAKNYGWGWYPSSWQGWLIVGTYVSYITYTGFEMNAMFDTWTSATFRYIFEIVIPTIILIIICYITGEKPEWRWGKKK